MNNITEIQNKLAQIEDHANSLDIDILFTEEQIRNEIDDINITFLTDHLGVLNYQLDRTNADIYILRQKLKYAENQKKLQLNL